MRGPGSEQSAVIESREGRTPWEPMKQAANEKAEGAMAYELVGDGAERLETEFGGAMPRKGLSPLENVRAVPLGTLLEQLRMKRGGSEQTLMRRSARAGVELAAGLRLVTGGPRVAWESTRRLEPAHLTEGGAAIAFVGFPQEDEGELARDCNLELAPDRGGGEALGGEEEEHGGGAREVLVEGRGGLREERERGGGGVRAGWEDEVRLWCGCGTAVVRLRGGCGQAAVRLREEGGTSRHAASTKTSEEGTRSLSPCATSAACSPERHAWET